MLTDADGKRKDKMSGERILVVEDDVGVGRGLVYALEDEGFQVQWAKRGQQALEAVNAARPQIVLLDIRLPDISGFDVCKQLRTTGHKMPILMLTARDEEVDRVLGLELGADDYIVKPYSLREVVSRIRAQLRRAYGSLASTINTSLLSFDELQIDLERLTVRVGGRLVPLTPIEFRLLRLLASNPERPFTRSEIIERVWGYDDEIESERTIDVHVRHLRQKLESDPAHPRWIRTARGVGYSFRP
jgi:DNA-binding response OmpR family regulator